MHLYRGHGCADDLLPHLELGFPSSESKARRSVNTARLCLKLRPCPRISGCKVPVDASNCSGSPSGVSAGPYSLILSEAPAPHSLHLSPH
jgi:hypothetical protein